MRKDEDGLAYNTCAKRLRALDMAHSDNPAIDVVLDELDVLWRRLNRHQRRLASTSAMFFSRKAVM